MDLSGIGSLYTDQMSQAASNASGDNLKAKLNNSSNATDDELMEVCKEFEAYFTEQVYKEMLKTVPKHEGEKTEPVRTDEEKLRAVNGYKRFCRFF